jgi:hypothetical protein
VQTDHVLWFPDHKLGTREFPDSWWLFVVRIGFEDYQEKSLNSRLIKDPNSDD